MGDAGSAIRRKVQYTVCGTFPSVSKATALYVLCVTVLARGVALLAKFFFAPVTEYLTCGKCLVASRTAKDEKMLDKLPYHFMGSSPFEVRIALVFEKCLQPRKPREADKGLGCTLISL